MTCNDKVCKTSHVCREYNRCMFKAGCLRLDCDTEVERICHICSYRICENTLHVIEDHSRCAQQHENRQAGLVKGWWDNGRWVVNPRWNGDE